MKLKSQKYLTNIFVNIVKYLGILTEKESATFTKSNLSEVEMALKKYKNHPSTTVTITKQMKNLGNYFQFQFHLTW